ncbi:hypothetical protein E2C01_012363 [Portunus trituberculatus]|uniref:Uncharacterized protein n=1 Tax=Portunus trituberculatus TaxID=210409 RepID=A0A5B7DDY8_PORTR|nr:hypothetical protein [Portunus trituberculatus]
MTTKPHIPPVPSHYLLLLLTRYCDLREELKEDSIKVIKVKFNTGIRSVRGGGRGTRVYRERGVSPNAPPLHQHEPYVFIKPNVRAAVLVTPASHRKTDVCQLRSPRT